jgi:hypothetical protein
MISVLVIKRAVETTVDLAIAAPGSVLMQTDGSPALRARSA